MEEDGLAISSARSSYSIVSYLGLYSALQFTVDVVISITIEKSYP